VTITTTTTMAAAQDAVIAIATTEDYDTLVRTATGTILLLLYWPGDATSETALRQLTRRLPQCAALGAAGVYSLDVYALPKIAEELDTTFVPTLLWFNDQVQEGLVWHQGVRVPGESVGQGIGRVLDVIAQARVEEDDGYDDAWENC
jgi:hypothetical protein